MIELDAVFFQFCGMDAMASEYFFGMEFLKQLCNEQEGNFVFSPLSLGITFAMLAAGLKGETKSEVLTLLGYKDEGALHEKYAGALANQNLPLKIGSKFLVNHEIKVLREYDDFLKVSPRPTLALRIKICAFWRRNP